MPASFSAEFYVAREWSPYDTSDIDQLLSEIVDEFRSKHPRLNSQGLGN